MSPMELLAYSEMFYTSKITTKVLSKAWLWNRTQKTKSNENQNAVETAKLLHPAEPLWLKIPVIKSG